METEGGTYGVGSYPCVFESVWARADGRGGRKWEGVSCGRGGAGAGAGVAVLAVVLGGGGEGGRGAVLGGYVRMVFQGVGFGGSGYTPILPSVAALDWGVYDSECGSGGIGDEKVVVRLCILVGPGSSGGVEPGRAVRLGLFFYASEWGMWANGACNMTRSLMVGRADRNIIL